MKKMFAVVCMVALVIPFTTNAAWYWLANPENPKLGDFVNFSALEYAEFESKHLLTYIEDGSMEIIDEAKNFNRCENELDDLIELLEGGEFSSTGLEYMEASLVTCVKKERRENKLQEAFAKCDTDFIDSELTNSEKISYNEQVVACRESTPEDLQQGVTSHTETQPSMIQNAIPTVVPYTSEGVSQTEEDRVSVEDNGGEEIIIQNQEGNEIADTSGHQEVTSTAKNFFQKFVDFFVQLFDW